VDLSERLFMVFDVESVGLNGEGFAVGFVVIGGDGTELDWGLFACDHIDCVGAKDDMEWVEKNIGDIFAPYGCSGPRAVRDAFWNYWMKWKSRGAWLAADCCWPVESRFLQACVEDDTQYRKWEGPYPLIDVSTAMLAAGRDPLSENDRLPNELPAHNPLADARQSARLLIECLKSRIV
jgi:hypothetical protein